MRNLSPALSAKLGSGVTTLAQAWRLTRTDGLVIGVTQHDQDLTFDGTLFVAANSFVGGDHEKQVQLGADRSALSGALSIGAIEETDLELGRWDHARVEAFWVDWTAPQDFIAMWTGIIAGTSWRGSVFELDVVGQEFLLNREIGRVYSRTCDAALGDVRCKVNLAIAARTINAAITRIDTDRSITIAVPAGKSPADFDNGALTIINGRVTSWRSNVVAIVSGASSWNIQIARPFPVAPHVGDNIAITMGCDKSFTTCKARFGNSLKFRGQPSLPGDDVAFGGPSASGNDGGGR